MSAEIVYLSLGAGVQSSALYVACLAGLVDPAPEFAVFADPGGESAATYRYLDYLDGLGGDRIPIYRVSGGSVYDSVGRSGSRSAAVPFWTEGEDGRASPGRRQCTRELKVDPIRRFIRARLGLKPGERAAGRYSVECLLGISLDEVTRAAPSRDSWVTNVWPLIYQLRWRRQDCIDYLAAGGHPIPSRSACVICPYRGIEEHRALRDEDPEGFEKACQVDEGLRDGGPRPGWRKLQYVHRSLRPLREVIDDPELEDRQVDLFENACGAECGV